jgi:AcrR family transcriptional regulator
MLIRKDSRIRQKEISLAARKLIVKYGSEHVTVSRMAKEIGVTESAIYRHFKSKRDILSFLADDIETNLNEDIEEHYSGKLDSLETLRTIVAEHISSIEQRKGVTFQVIAEIISLGDKKLNKRIYEAINRYIDRIKGILSAGVEAGVIRDDIDLDITAKLFFGLTQGLVNRWALSQYSFNLEDEFKSSWEVFLKGVASPAGTPKRAKATN